MPQGLMYFSKVLPLTHGLALMRYGLLGDRSGLENIWGMSSTGTMATLSLGVVALFAAILTAVSIRVFTRSSVR
jgi:ABC-type polysaccharide/polyol phosphate export permease